MGTLGSGTAVATATAYSNQRKEDRTQNGVLWGIFAPPTTGTLAFVPCYSTDGGSTWSTDSAPANGSGNTNNTYTWNGSLFIDVDDYAHVAFKDAGNGFIYYRRGTPNTARTAYTWSAATTINASASFDVPDIVVCRDPATSGAWVGYVVLSFAGNQNVKTYGYRINISAAGTVTVGSQDQISAATPATNSNLGYANVDFNHNGDGKTVAGGTPHWYVGWSAGAAGSGYGIRYRKATYASGSWTWGTEREIDNTRYISAVGTDWINCLFDGARVVIVGHVYGGATNYTVILHDRDAADTTTTTRYVTPNSGAGADYYDAGSASYDSSGNIYIFATPLGTDGSVTSFWQKWTRATATLSAKTAIDASGRNYPYFSARRGYAGQAIDYVYTDGTASPYTVTSGRIVLNQNPTAPTQLTPADNATWDSASDQTVTLGYSDPDGNPASKVRVYYRPKGTSAPFAVIEQNTSAASGTNIPVTVPAGTWPGEIQWYGTVADSSGAWSDASPTRTVTGIPAGLAAATGGGGGTAFSAWTISNATENARLQRIGTRSVLTSVTAVSPLTITVDGGPLTAQRNAGYTPVQGDTVQADYVSGVWVVQDKVLA